jgi:Spy/CpxP family protein refolding chaperone
MLVRLLILCAFMCVLAFSQSRGGGMGGEGGGGGMGEGMGGMGGGMGSGMPRQQRQSKADQIADKLKLNKDQKEQVATIMDAAREESSSLREQLPKARLELADAMLNAKGEEEIKKARDAYAVLVAQMTGIEAKAFGKIYALLKPNQQAKASQAWDLMADIFVSGGRGAGRGNGRGRGQGGDRN